MEHFNKILTLMKSNIINCWSKVKEYINNLSLFETCATMLTTVLFILFHYLLNAVPEVASDIIGFSFLGYLLICCVFFILKRRISLLILHIVVLLISLYSIFWFVF